MSSIEQQMFPNYFKHWLPNAVELDTPHGRRQVALEKHNKDMKQSLIRIREKLYSVKIYDNNSPQVPRATN